MSDLADLFPGFASHWIDTEAGKIFARSGGSGPPLVLIHGFPQTHVEWHRIAPGLAARHTVVIPDLRGYGWSAIPDSAGGEMYTKRRMAEDVIALMEALGHVRFSVVGHDRGGRVAYRLALDHPGRVEQLAVLDIVPTGVMWAKMDAARAMQVYHWTFLAQPEPLPEKLIGTAARDYLDWTLASWTKARSLACFDPRALAHYRASATDPKRIHAFCEDYRAGATLDRAHDDADSAAGKTIGMPVLALWGDAGIPGKARNVLDIWRDWAADVSGYAIDCGHFLPEEAPEATLAALAAFLK
jgi:haloacetate dehalogenase